MNTPTNSWLISANASWLPTRRTHPPSDGPKQRKLRRPSSEHQVSRAVYAERPNGRGGGSPSLAGDVSDLLD